LDLIPNLSKSDVVILMSAATNQEWIYKYTKKSDLINIQSAVNIIDCAVSRGAKIIYPSSENIFDGEKDGYLEEDMACTLNHYGKQKVEIEYYLKKI
jgi:dTDP-4-dehydrorhamnose reductase